MMSSRSIDLRQVFDRAVQALSQHGVDARSVRADRVHVLEVRFPFPEPLHLAHRIRHDRDGDAMEPGAESAASPRNSGS